MLVPVEVEHAGAQLDQLPAAADRAAVGERVGVIERHRGVVAHRDARAGQTLAASAVADSGACRR